MEVIATIWKKPYYTDRNQRLIEAGVDAFRIKCSHWGAEDISEALFLARQQLSENKKGKLLADLPEAKIRLGEFPQQKVDILKGVELRFKSAEFSEDIQNFVPVNFAGIGDFVDEGDEFYIGDGQLAFRVIKKFSNDEFLAVAQNNSLMNFKTGLSIPKVMDTLNHVTPFIDEVIEVLPRSRPEMVAFSFVNSASMAEELKNKIVKKITPDWKPKIIAKIESQKGVDNIDEILEVVDGIMVARGDLALNVPYYKLGALQKLLVKKAKDKNKYVIVATQVLQSMLSNYLPMRSDILDVTNAYLDGASAIMLCMETAHNENPEQPVITAKKIINYLSGNE